MPNENFTLIQSDAIAAIIYTLLTIAFFVVPFIIYFSKKTNSMKLIEKYMQVFPNPDEAMAAYERDKQNLTIVEPFRKNSLISIIYYFVIFYILAEVISAVAIVIYLKANGFSKDIINPESPLYNPDVYEHMANFLNLVLQIVIYSIATIGVLIIMWKPFKNDFKKINGKTFALGAMGYGLSMAGGAASVILFAILGITARKGEATNQEAIDSMFSSSPMALIILFFVIVIMAPIVEELVFRKSFFTIIKDPKLALIISSMVFGGLHVISGTLAVALSWIEGSATYLDVILELVFIIQYSLMGLGFGIAYIKSNKNVCTTIFSHMLNNGVSFVVTLLSVLFPDVFESLTNIIMSII